LSHQLPLGTDGVESLHQQRAQQLFGWDRGAAILGVERGKLGVEGFQRFIGDATDQAQRVVAGDPALRAHVTVPDRNMRTHQQLDFGWRYDPDRIPSHFPD
jgi:hypothetical protein